jgi:hypothetical protein
MCIKDEFCKNRIANALAERVITTTTMTTMTPRPSIISTTPAFLREIEESFNQEEVPEILKETSELKTERFAFRTLAIASASALAAIITLAVVLGLETAYYLWLKK